MKRMQWWTALAVLLAFAEPAFAASSENVVYWSKLTTIFFNFLLKASTLLSLIALFWISWMAMRTILNPNLKQQMGDKPITVARFGGGLIVVSMLALPLNYMEAFNDITGLSGGSNTMCLSVEVSASNLKWAGSAAQCIERAESQFAKLAEYNNKEHIKSANIGLLFMVVQTVSLFFFIVSGFMLVMHAAGKREVKLTVGQALMSMLVASMVFASINLVDYIEDFKGQQNVILPG